jgi:hypothetical protein
MLGESNGDAPRVCRLANTHRPIDKDKATDIAYGMHLSLQGQKHSYLTTDEILRLGELAIPYLGCRMLISGGKPCILPRIEGLVRLIRPADRPVPELECDRIAKITMHAQSDAGDQAARA